MTLSTPSAPPPGIDAGPFRDGLVLPHPAMDQRYEDPSRCRQFLARGSAGGGGAPIHARTQPLSARTARLGGFPPDRCAGPAQVSARPALARRDPRPLEALDERDVLLPISRSSSSGPLGCSPCSAASPLVLFVLYHKIFTGKAVTAWSSQMLSILFFSGVNLFGIGVLGEYVARIYDELKARPAYIVDRINESASAANAQPQSSRPSRPA